MRIIVDLKLYVNQTEMSQTAHGKNKLHHKTTKLEIESQKLPYYVLYMHESQELPYYVMYMRTVM